MWDLQKNRNWCIIPACVYMYNLNWWSRKLIRLLKYTVYRTDETAVIAITTIHVKNCYTGTLFNEMFNEN